jgi:ornithine cyclodeaminase/alanine dehydrogenase-like protein (mu-crystallin family)
MRIVSAGDLARIFTYPDLVEVLKNAFQRGVVLPLRHHHTIVRSGEPPAILLLMPAWDLPEAAAGDGGYLGVKVLTTYPGNAARGKPSLSATYLLASGATGEALAVIDGTALTLWRTAAASALAASFLARPDASRLVLVGAGALARYLVEAHASAHPVSDVLIWNRHGLRAERLAADLAGRPYTVRATDDLEQAVRAADIISCATSSHEPLVHGRWLKRGVHLDLVGGFTPDMRECDDDAVRRARLYVDTREGALKEAGDLILPFQAGVRRESDVVGDLFDLCRGKVQGRRSEGEITLFKSVGTALEDLAAATLAFERRSNGAGVRDGLKSAAG